MTERPAAPQGELSPGKKELLELERTGKYVFHGSDHEGSVFVPQQAYNYNKGEKKPDGPPGVFASAAADYAIFMAMSSKKNCPAGYQTSAGTRDGKLAFLATQKSLDQLTDASQGVVHVFEREDFVVRHRKDIEYIAQDPVMPMKSITVTKRDLPENIEIIPEEGTTAA